MIGVALIVGRAVAGLASDDESESELSYNGTGEMPFEMILQQLTWTLAPAMISTGFLVLVGLLFERAIRWQRERRAAS